MITFNNFSGSFSLYTEHTNIGIFLLVATSYHCFFCTGLSSYKLSHICTAMQKKYTYFIGSGIIVCIVILYVEHHFPHYGSRAFVLFSEVVLWWQFRANMQFIAPSTPNIPR